MVNMRLTREICDGRLLRHIVPIEKEIDRIGAFQYYV